MVLVVVLVSSSSSSRSSSRSSSSVVFVVCYRVPAARSQCVCGQAVEESGLDAGFFLFRQTDERVLGSACHESVAQDVSEGHVSGNVIQFLQTVQPYGPTAQKDTHIRQLHALHANNRSLQSLQPL